MKTLFAIIISMSVQLSYAKTCPKTIDIPEFFTKRFSQDVYDFTSSPFIRSAVLVSGTLEALEEPINVHAGIAYAKITKKSDETLMITRAPKGTKECKKGLYAVIDNCYPKFCGEYDVVATIACLD